MKKLLLSAIAAATFCAPAAFAGEDKVKTWRSYDSVGCMMLRECQQGVDAVISWQSLGSGMEPFKEEIESILTSLYGVGIKVYLADNHYFLPRMRGLYDVSGNNLFLNRYYIGEPTKMIQVLRHEGWHAAQDCMAGTLDNNFTAIIHPEEEVPGWIRRGAERTYPPNAVPWEAEAMWAMYSDTQTKTALEVCASSSKMWEVFQPTPLTAKWLKEQGFMD